MKKLVLIFIFFINNVVAYQNKNVIEKASANELIAITLDNFHQAAAKADFKKYFSLLSDNAIFLGTDATERWTKKEFESFVKPYFKKGIGWLYKPEERHITMNKEQNMAFFDELLTNESYGQCRGSGVLIKTSNSWKITQYNLSIPMPNEIAKQMVAQIKSYQKEHRNQ